MSKEIFSSTKVNSFRLTAERANDLNLLIADSQAKNVGEAIGAISYMALQFAKGVQDEGLKKNIIDLQQRVSDLQRRNADLKTENGVLKLSTVNRQPSTDKNPLTFPAYLSLKKELESVLFKDCEIIPEISDEDFVNLLVDTCQRDPCNEFPSPALAQAIYDKHKNVNNVEEKKETGEQSTPGTTGAATQSGANPG